MVKRAGEINIGSKEIDPPIVVLKDIAKRVSKDHSTVLIAPELREMLAELGTLTHSLTYSLTCIYKCMYI